MTKKNNSSKHLRMREPDFVMTSADSRETRQKLLESLAPTKVPYFSSPSPRRKAGGCLSDEEKKHLLASIPTRGVSTKPY